MSENTPEDQTFPDKIVSVTSAATIKANEAALKVADAVDNIDTEKLGKHARSLKDRVELFVYDNKAELTIGLFFAAGVWVGRRGVRKAVDKAIKEKPNHMTFFEMFGVEPDGRHVILPPVEWDKLDLMSRHGSKLTYEVGSHMVDVGARPAL